jgi:hypothetical protein
MSGLLVEQEALGSWGVQEGRVWAPGRVKKLFKDDYTRATCPCSGCAGNRADALTVARLLQGGQGVEALGAPRACLLDEKWSALEAEAAGVL